MSESVDILIQADNQASAKLKTVGNDLEGLSKRAKETGRNTKASVEIVGSLANAFGGTAIGAFASQMGQLTEKVSAFSEVAKTGTAGAMAFKVGIVAAAGAVTYKVAETVAAWWFEIDKATQKAEAAEKAFAKMSAATQGMRQKAFSQAREDIGLIRDPGDREKATNEQAAKIEKQARELDGKIKAAQTAVAQKQDALNKAFFKADAQTDVDIAQQQLDTLQSLRDELDNEASSLRDLTSERAKSIEARKAENAQADRSDAFLKGLRDEIEMLKATKEERQKLEASRNATPQQARFAEELIRERDLLREKAEAEKKAELEREQAAKKEEDAIKRIAELEKKRKIDLEARRIELNRGKEAAEAYRLEQEGLSKATAAKLAAAEEQIRKDEAKAKANVPKTTTAFESRIMMRGPTQDPQVTELKKIQDQNKITNQKLEQIYQESKKRGQMLEVQVVQ